MSDETLLWKQKQWSARIILMMKAIGNYATSVIIICWIESKVVGRLKKVIAHGNRETDSQLLCMYPTTSYLRWTLGHKRENPFFFFFKFQNLYEQRQGFPRTNGVKTKQEEFFAGENHFDYYMGPPSSLFGMIVNSLEFISNLYLYTNFRLVGRAESLHQNPINPILQFWIFFLFVSSVVKLLVS